MRFRQTKEGYWMPVDYTDKSPEQQPASDENIIDDDDKKSKPKTSKK